MAEPKNEEYIRRIVNGILDVRLKEKSYYDLLSNSMVSSFDYNIHKIASSVKLIDGSTGSNIKSSSSLATILQYINDTLEGGSVVIKTGAYSIDSNTTITKNLSLIAQPGGMFTKGVVLTMDNLVNANMFTVNGGGTDVKGTRFENLTLEGNYGNNTAGDGIEFTGSWHENIVANCNIFRFKDHGITASGAADFLRIDNCILEHNQDTNIYLNVEAQISRVISAYAKWGMCIVGEPVHITDSYFAENDQYGILNSNGTLLMSNCRLRNNSAQTAGAYDGIMIANGDLTQITNCFIEDTGNSHHQYGIDIDASSVDTRINNCKIDSGATGKIRDQGGTRTVIHGLGKESANAETPQDADWLIGDRVDFTDSGDGSGDGIYIKNTSGGWTKLA